MFLFSLLEGGAKFRFLCVVCVCGSRDLPLGQHRFGGCFCNSLRGALASALWTRKKKRAQEKPRGPPPMCFPYTHSVLRRSGARPGESLAGDEVVSRFKIQKRVWCGLSSPVTCGIGMHSWRIMCNNTLLIPSRNLKLFSSESSAASASLASNIITWMGGERIHT